jgi:TolB-like protein
VRALTGFISAGVLAWAVCLAPSTPAATRPTVAVLLFDYQGHDPQLEPLRDGIAEMMISDLSAISQIRVVERKRLKDVLAEQDLGKSGRLDPTTAARVGRLLGAQFLVMGSLVQMQAALNIMARVVDVETGEIVRAARSEGPLADVAPIQRDLVIKLGQGIAAALPGHPLPPAPPPAAAPIPAAAVAAYGSALGALDRGKKDEARSTLRRLLEQAPLFKLAVDQYNRLLHQ